MRCQWNEADEAWREGDFLCAQRDAHREEGGDLYITCRWLGLRFDVLHLPVSK